MSYKRKEDPVHVSCFKLCKSCFRCSQKGSRSDCNSCSGRVDPDLNRENRDMEDRCRCAEGILQYRLPNGQLLIKKFPHNPYEGKVVDKGGKSQDERDWDAYVKEQREERGDPDFDPLTFDDGSSVTDWMDR